MEKRQAELLGIDQSLLGCFAGDKVEVFGFAAFVSILLLLLQIKEEHAAATVTISVTKEAPVFILDRGVDLQRQGNESFRLQGGLDCWGHRGHFLGECHLTENKVLGALAALLQKSDSSAS